jgi:hypothetical protein
MQDVLESIKECIIRFFDNLFTHRNDELELQREWIMQLEKERMRSDELVQFIKDQLAPKEQVLKEIPRDLKPIMTNQVPWAIKKAQLEREDRERFRNMNSSKPIEELEKELGVNNASQIP